MTLENYSRLCGPLDLPIEVHSRNADDRLLILVDSLKPVMPPALLQMKQAVHTAIPQQQQQPPQDQSQQQQAAGTTASSPRDSRVTVGAIDVRETRSTTDVSTGSPMGAGGRDRAGTSLSRKYSPLDVYVRDRIFEKNCLVCRATVQREVEYRLLDIFSRREYFKNNDVMKGLTQTCQVSGSDTMLFVILMPCIHLSLFILLIVFARITVGAAAEKRGPLVRGPPDREINIRVLEGYHFRGASLRLHRKPVFSE